MISKTILGFVMIVHVAVGIGKFCGCARFDNEGINIWHRLEAWIIVGD